MYMTYTEYQSYGGPDLADTATYERLEFKARKRIDYLTDSRVGSMETVPESVKRAMVEIIRHEIKFGVDAQTTDPLVASFNTDGYSESYGSASDQTKAAEANLLRSIRNMLHGEADDNGTPLLYRGVYS